MSRTLGLPAAVLLAATCSVACAGRFDPANFEGAREARRAEPEAVREVAARTDELETLGAVHDSCKLRPGFRRLDGEALSDLDCSTERLDWALRESAASAGGEVLVGLRCSSRRLGTSASETYAVSCSAEVARYKRGPLANPGPLTAPRSIPPGLPAPSASDVKRIDQPDASLAFRIALAFEPAVAKFERRLRSPSEVKELALLPIADLPLGDLAATCADGCDERAPALRRVDRGWAHGRPGRDRCALFQDRRGRRLRGHAGRAQRGRIALLGLPIEVRGHGDGIQQAQAHRALVGRALELRACLAHALGRRFGERDLNGELGDAARRCAGHGFLHVHARALEREAAFASHNAHDRGHARAEASGHQVRRGEGLATAVIVDRCVRYQHRRRRAVLGLALQITLIFDEDIDHARGSWFRP